MAKYSQEFKLEVVNYYLSGQGGLKRTGQHFGIYYTMVRKWVGIFKHHGAQALRPKEKHNRYSAAFKYQVIEAIHQKGLSLKQATLEFSVMEPATVLGWLRLYTQGGVSALQPKVRGRLSKMKKPPRFNKKPDTQKTPEELLEELEYLRAENAYLKKLEALILEQQIQDKKPKSSQG